MDILRFKSKFNKFYGHYSPFLMKLPKKIILTWFFLFLVFFERIFSKYPHPNIFLTLFLKSQQKTDVILQKLVVTHIPGRFYKKWTQNVPDGRTQRVLSHHTKYNLSHKWYFWGNRSRSKGIFFSKQLNMC